MSALPHLVEDSGIVHLCSSTTLATRCGLEYTVGREYAKPWPSKVIVRHMERSAAAPTCVVCVGAT